MVVKFMPGSLQFTVANGRYLLNIGHFIARRDTLNRSGTDLSHEGVELRRGFLP